MKTEVEIEVRRKPLQLLDVFKFKKAFKMLLVNG